MATASNKRVDLQFGLECLGCVGLTILFHLLQVSYLSSSGLFIWTLIGGIASGLIWLTDFWRARNAFRSVVTVSLKLASYTLYSLVLIMVVNALLAIVWQGTHFWAQGLLSLGTILIIGLSLPGFFKLVVNETNPVLRMVSIFFYYLGFGLFPQSLGFGNHYVNDYGAPYWVAFISATLLVIYAMVHWEYQLPKLKFNHHLNYWWLALLIVPRFLVMGMSAGSWSRLFSLPLQIRWVIPNDSLTTATIYVIFTIVTVCFKEELIFRYLFLAQILNAVKGSVRTRILKTTLITATLFAAWHLHHIFYQPLATTSLQILAAFGMGVVFAIIYLYIGTIWVTVIMHSIFDLFSVDMAGSVTPFVSQPTSFLVEFIVITTAIQVVLGLIAIYTMKTGPFEQTIRANQRKQALRRPVANLSES
ncbi:CPBP family intramembrane metalloprotease [Lentilactobacillus sp. IMAU92037]|uniref:CPBP family intramembrane glutamic endopeptidase n=1 Tax=Lentilactobacillus dabitei TaxID=2831523 RepID=UPI001C26CD26|nr:CPBP family intramembrane glutamic endopeptidase [Lentilactobacillus dabitei]MBU9789146.1 CPBP family intramembrane metalloprotease [Lentilactobacillus dabitei]MBV0931207.1 CPBP family intramembrane metalloprotease [Lentilactobacillus dabitei]